MGEELWQRHRASQEGFIALTRASNGSKVFVHVPKIATVALGHEPFTAVGLGNEGKVILSVTETPSEIFRLIRQTRVKEPLA